jgi:CheY-like chemotaxis protein/Tfp pilus assembly protein PilZ
MRKVVVIDSSETFSRYLGRVISALGYETEHAPDIEAGFALIKAYQPDLVISEMYFPNHSGLELCEKLKKDHCTADIPIVIVSTDGTSGKMRLAVQAGCADYRTKPMTVGEVHQLLQRNLSFATKRRAIRLNIAEDVVLVAGGRRIETRTATLGEGGMLVRTDSDVFHAGLPIDISVWLRPPGEPLMLSGEVIYVSEPAGPLNQRGVGIKFTAVSREAADQLAQYLERAVS